MGLYLVRLKGRGETSEAPRAPWVENRHGRQGHHGQRAHHSTWIDNEQLDGIPGSGAVCSPNQTYLKCCCLRKAQGKHACYF